MYNEVFNPDDLKTPDKKKVGIQGSVLFKELDLIKPIEFNPDKDIEIPEPTRETLNEKLNKYGGIIFQTHEENIKCAKCGFYYESCQCHTLKQPRRRDLFRKLSKFFRHRQKIRDLQIYYRIKYTQALDEANYYLKKYETTTRKIENTKKIRGDGIL